MTCFVLRHVWSQPETLPSWQVNRQQQNRTFCVSMVHKVRYIGSNMLCFAPPYVRRMWRRSLLVLVTTTFSALYRSNRDIKPFLEERHANILDQKQEGCMQYLTKILHISSTLPYIKSKRLARSLVIRTFKSSSISVCISASVPSPSAPCSPWAFNAMEMPSFMISCTTNWFWGEFIIIPPPQKKVWVSGEGVGGYMA